MLPIRVILVGKIIWGERKLEDSVSKKLSGSLDDSYLSKSILRSPNKSICLEDSLESFCNKGEIAIKISNMKHKIIISNNFGVWTNNFYEYLF